MNYSKLKLSHHIMTQYCISCKSLPIGLYV